MLATLVKTLYRPLGGTLCDGHGGTLLERGTFFRLIICLDAGHLSENAL